MTVNLKRALEDYIDYWEKLTPRSIRLIEKMAVPYMTFIDPFNDVQGIEAVEAVFEKMFRDVDQPSFKVNDAAWGRDEHTAYLRWVLTFSPKGKTERWQIFGMSEVTFGADGKVFRHVDYWDSGSQLMARLPVLSWFYNRLRKRLAA